MPRTIRHTWISVDGDLLNPASWDDGLAPSIAATATLTFTGNALNNETVTIDGKVYTFETTLTDINGHVKIGVDAAESRSNLRAAINLDAGAGTLYAASTTLHPTVKAADESTDKLVATAKIYGSDANGLVTAESLTNGSWSGNLAGGSEWTWEDLAVFDGSSAVSATLNVDLGTLCSPRPAFQATTAPDFRGALGGSAAPIAGFFNNANETGRHTIKGSGRSYFAPWSTGSFDEYIVDAPNNVDALTITGGFVLNVHSLSGGVVIVGDVRFIEPVSGGNPVKNPGSMLKTYGPSALIDVNTTHATRPYYVVTNGGLIKVRMDSKHTFRANGGILEITGRLLDDASLIIYPGAIVRYTPASDISTETIGLILDGILDMSKSKYAISANPRIIGPDAVMFGPPVEPAFEQTSIDLREEYP